MIECTLFRNNPHIDLQLVLYVLNERNSKKVHMKKTKKEQVMKYSHNL